MKYSRLKAWVQTGKNPKSIALLGLASEPPLKAVNSSDITWMQSEFAGVNQLLVPFVIPNVIFFALIGLNFSFFTLRYIIPD